MVIKGLKFHQINEKEVDNKGGREYDTVFKSKY